MYKNSVAVIVGLLFALPSLGWAQGAKQAARPPVDIPAFAAARYDQGQKLERSGDWTGAMQAYTESAENGHGPAQKRLGEIYNNGQGDVKRDYDTSLRWYKRAQESGEQVPQPFTYPGVRQR